MSALLSLAGRCEEATGPDRALDEDLMFAVSNIILDNPPGYTASLDAAMTLVPEGYDWAVFRTNGGLTVHAWCGNREDVFAATPALALCAAALRARAAMEGDGE